jgi:1,4-dihydroxy-2-naphthoate octaprenyltransferase
VVRAGWRKGRWGYPLLAACSGLSLVLLVAQGLLPLVTLVALLALIPAAMAAPLVLRYAGQPRLLAPAIRLTIVAALSQGLLLSITLAW